MTKLKTAAVVGLVLIVGGIAVSQQASKPKAVGEGQGSTTRSNDTPTAGGGTGVHAEPELLRREVRKGEAMPALSDELAAVGGPGIPGVPQRVVKTANIEVRIGKDAFQKRFNRASAIAEELGGFVTNSSTEQTKGRVASGTLTMRVPSDRFQEALTKIRGLGKVTGESQSGQDVTREFVDLEARLRHAKAQEAFFLKLMDQSKTVSDLLQVQQQLANVQLEIEQLQGQINYLKDQTSFSSITARIFEPVAAGSPEPKGFGKALREAWAGFRTVIGGTVVFLGWVTPMALMGLVGYGLWRAIRRKAAPAV